MIIIHRLMNTLIREIVGNCIRICLHYFEQFPSLLFLLGPLTKLEGAFETLQTMKHLHILLMNAVIFPTTSRLMHG